MFNLYKNIADIAAEHGYTPSGLMVAMGKPKSTLSNLKNGRIESLSVLTIQQIADFLCEPYDRVAHGTPNEHDDDILNMLFEDERTLLQGYRTMDKEHKDAILVFVRGYRRDRGN